MMNAAKASEIRRGILITKLNNGPGTYFIFQPGFSSTGIVFTGIAPV